MRSPSVARTLVILALAAALPAFANHVPDPPKDLIEGTGRAQVTLNLGTFDPLLEVQARLEDPTTSCATGR